MDLLDENLNISLYVSKPASENQIKSNANKARKSLVTLFSKDGRKLNSEVSLHYRDEWFDYIFESRGGTKGSSNERNPDYFEALEIVLHDAKSKSWLIRDIVVASKKLEALPISQKRVHPENYSFPIHLNEQVDVVSLRKAISNSVSKVGKEPGSKGGNPTKRIRITFSKEDSYSSPEVGFEETQDILSKFHKKKVNHKFKNSGPPPSGQRKAPKIEQNKPGYTYVFKLEGVKEDALKIGFTGNLSKRLNDLNSEIRPSVTGLRWIPVTFWQFDDVQKAYEFEQEIQLQLRDCLYEGEREYLKYHLKNYRKIKGRMGQMIVKM